MDFKVVLQNLPILAKIRSFPCPLVTLKLGRPVSILPARG